MHVVATAGHVDHGKSTLVLALTGTDPDRWDEEKRRGLTIDLGFAATTLPSGAEVAFVDVPGHVRFLKNMLAGVGAVDACLFVVAATEGWKPQSEEHLRILELLGVGHGVVALTKVGPVDEEWAELARLDVADHLAGTFLASADIVGVDAVAGTGVDAVAEALDRLLGGTPRAADRSRPRLWVDRAFAARGSGTVVTGTLTGGGLVEGDELELWMGRDVPRRVRVRGLQTHGRSMAHVGPGHRVAVNLTGVPHADVERGHALVRPGQWAPTRRADASLHVLAALGHDVSRRGAWLAYVGSGEQPVRVRVLGSEALAPGATGAVRLHLPVWLPLEPGDRFVLRESGRNETVGGGEVLDVEPVLPASRARPDRSVERLVAERGWVRAGHLARLVGADVAPTLGLWVVDPAARARVEEAVRAAVALAGAGGLDVAGMGERERLVLATLGDVEVDAGRARLAGHRPDPLATHPYQRALEAALFSPPTPEEAGVTRTDARELVRGGLAVERDGVWFATLAVERAAVVLAGLLAEHPDGITVAQVRDALGTTRKHALPLVALLDARGVTRRRGDLRIAGPRLPSPA